MFKNLSQVARARVRASLVIAFAVILMITVVLYFNGLSAYVMRVLGILTPFLVGFAFAFLMIPIAGWIETLLRHTLFRKGKHLRLCRGLSSILCVIILIAIITSFSLVLIPNVATSIESVLNYATKFYNAHYPDLNANLIEWGLLKEGDDALLFIWNNFVSEVTSFTSFIVDNLLTISNIVYNVLYNILVGLVVMFYVLFDKERFCAEIKKITYAFLPEKRANLVVTWTHRTNDLFAGFIRGKLLDSLIIGIITFFTMFLINREYAILIAMIVGVTNIIPFFGPFIGAVPCALILFIVNPMQAVWFLVAIVIIQQLDGNIIGPYILGDRIGLSPLWVMVAIILGSGLFGFPGMLLGVPMFALAYAIIKAVSEVRLEDKHLPVETASYDAAFAVPEKQDENGK